MVTGGEGGGKGGGLRAGDGWQWTKRSWVTPDMESFAFVSTVSLALFNTALLPHVIQPWHLSDTQRKASQRPALHSTWQARASCCQSENVDDQYASNLR